MEIYRVESRSCVLFFVYFRLYKQALQFLQQINVKNFHIVYSAGIRTHDLENTLPLDQGSLFTVNDHNWRPQGWNIGSFLVTSTL